MINHIDPYLITFASRSCIKNFPLPAMFKIRRLKQQCKKVDHMKNFTCRLLFFFNFSIAISPISVYKIIVQGRLLSFGSLNQCFSVLNIGYFFVVLQTLLEFDMRSKGKTSKCSIETKAPSHVCNCSCLIKISFPLLDSIIIKVASSYFNVP